MDTLLWFIAGIAWILILYGVYVSYKELKNEIVKQKIDKTINDNWKNGRHYDK